MNSSLELPEHQIFHILRQGEQEPIGPYSQNELVTMLNSDIIHANDYVYYPELDGWKRLNQVFDFHQEVTNFGNDGQDPHVVAESFNYINSRSEPGEEIYYVAVQSLPPLSLTAAVRLTTPKSLILTNCRFCILNPRLIGTIDFQEFPIEQIVSGLKRLKSDKSVGAFNIVLRSGDWVEIDKIPIAQLERLEEIAATLIAARGEH